MTASHAGLIGAVIITFFAGSMLLSFGLGAGWVTGYVLDDERGQTPAAVGVLLLLASLILAVVLWFGA